MLYEKMNLLLKKSGQVCSDFKGMKWSDNTIAEIMVMMVTMMMMIIIIIIIIIMGQIN